MDIGIVVTLVILAFGFGGWFYRLEYKLNKIDKSIMPLVILHQEEIIKHYLEKGILPNPGMTTRKQYLMDELKSRTMSVVEYQELSDILEKERKEAKRINDTDALIAILGLIALIAVLISLSKK